MTGKSSGPTISTMASAMRRVPHTQIRNPKLEIRNNLQIQTRNVPNGRALGFGISASVIGICFGVRILTFGFLWSSVWAVEGSDQFLPRGEVPVGDIVFLVNLLIRNGRRRRGFLHSGFLVLGRF